jgi:hypothetical protein
MTTNGNIRNVITASHRSTTSLDTTDKTINIHIYAKKPKNDVTYLNSLLFDINI